MAHYFTDIKAAIIVALQAATKVRDIYDYEETKPGGYPCITVTPSAGDGEFLDTTRIQRAFEFTIRVYQERVQAGAKEAERIITSLVDEILPLFEGAGVINLTNTVQFVKPPATKWGYLQDPDADVRTCEITVTGIVAQ